MTIKLTKVESGHYTHGDYTIKKVAKRYPWELTYPNGFTYPCQTVREARKFIAEHIRLRQERPELFY